MTAKEVQLAKGSKRWMFILLGIFINICLGTVYSWSVFRKPIEELLKISATQSGFPYMSFLFFYAVSMPIAGRYIDRYNPRKIAIIGGGLVALGWFLSGFAGNIYFLSVTYGIIAGTGVGIVYGVPISVAAKWYPDKKGLTVGLTLLGFGLSPFITAPLASYLIGLYGPLWTFRYLGIGFLLIITLLSLPLKIPQHDKERSQQDKKDMTAPANGLYVLRSAKFYFLWICYLIGTIIGLMAIAITSPVGVEVINLRPDTAALMLSVFAIFNGIGRPLFGWLTDKFSPQIASITSYLLILLASLLMLNAGEGDIFLYLFAFSLFWLNLGGWLAIAPTATGRFFGSKNYSKNYGYLFTAYGVGAIFGTLLSGRLRDLMGSYSYVFYPVILLTITGIIISLLFLNNNSDNTGKMKSLNKY